MKTDVAAKDSTEPHKEASSTPEFIGMTGPEPIGRRIFEAGALIALTVALGLVWTFLPDTARSFPTLANLRVVLLSQSVLVIVTVGVLIPLVLRKYDFSIGAVAGVSALIAAGHLSGGGSLWIAIILALGFALFVGLINGLLITVVGVDSVIVTLAMTTLLAGVATWLTGGQSIVTGIPEELLSVANPVVPGVPISFLIALLVTIGTAFMMASTPFGRYLHAIGSNASAARLVGLPTKRYTLTAFLLSAGYSGFAGILMLGISGAGNPQVGPELMLPAIAAAFLSVAAIKPGKFNVWGAFVAIIFLAVLNSGLNLLGVEGYVNDFANGLALIVGVALSALLRRHKGL